MTYYIRRIAQLGLNGSLHQAKKALSRYVVTLRHRNITEQDTLAVTGFSSAKELAAHFRTRSSPLFFIDRDYEFYRSALGSHFPGESEKIIASGDLVLKHIFDLLGSGPTDLDQWKGRTVKIIGRNGKIQRSEPAIGYLPWHIDFKSGIGWHAGAFYKHIRYRNLPPADVKVPWELSRFHHLILLGQAYCLTRDEAYPEEFVRQVSDWIDTNPCRYGVNWACTMEAGIRAVNWIWAFSLLRQSPRLNDAFILKFVTALMGHARFIRKNLEFNSEYIDGTERRLNSNHYVSDIVGLLYIATLFPELKLTADAEFAKKELETELFEQTWPDGVDYENSTFYHRLVTELFVSAFLLLRKNGHQLSQPVEERLEKMGEYVADYLRPDGTAPQIGDADNGRLHPLSARSAADHSYLPLLIAEEFDRPDLRIKSGDPEVLWWIGATPKTQFNHSRASAAYGNKSFFILGAQRSCVYVSAASVGMRGFGSHSHNDVLSFEYWANGYAWLIDPGTYVYTADPPARNYFRSTESHNTVRVDGQEINPFSPTRLFQMSDCARVKLHQWTSTPESDYLDIEHSGYTRLSSPVIHRRRFEFDKRKNLLTVRDTFEGNGPHFFEWFFHLAPEVRFQRSDSKFTLQAGDEMVLLDIGSINGDIQLQPGLYSPSYGVQQQSTLIVVRVQGSPKLEGTFTITAR